MAACGALAEAAGWQATFYATGAAGALWFVAWMLVVRDSPDVDPRITPQEKKFIQDALGSVKPLAAGVRRPWGRILRSPPVWAVAVAHFCEGWGYTTFLTQLPTFMTDALDFKLAKSGLLSALPYVAMIVSLPSVSVLSDWLVARKFLTVTQARKTFNCVAFLAQTVFLFLTTVVGSPYAVVACMTIAQGIGAFACCGFSVNPLDLAPQHASVIMGLSCTVSTLSGMISPLLTGFIVTDKTQEQWNKVFYVASSVYLFGAVFYFLFASGERQSWAKDGSEAEAEAENSAEAVPLKA
ncbi:Putative inorganic phosphate cotransporter [Gryllus bimaculatus]|nr:Putative inorganic phosphate cotransporter [Gryllus bimaculatus]